jgi:hypothetical protein
MASALQAKRKNIVGLFYGMVGLFYGMVGLFYGIVGLFYGSRSILRRCRRSAKTKGGQHLLYVVSVLQVMRMALPEMMRSLHKFWYKLNGLNLFVCCICR